MKKRRKKRRKKKKKALVIKIIHVLVFYNEKIREYNTKQTKLKDSYNNKVTIGHEGSDDAAGPDTTRSNNAASYNPSLKRPRHAIPTSNNHHKNKNNKKITTTT